MTSLYIPRHQCHDHDSRTRSARVRSRDPVPSAGLPLRIRSAGPVAVGRKCAGGIQGAALPGPGAGSIKGDVSAEPAAGSTQGAVSAEPDAGGSAGVAAAADSVGGSSGQLDTGRVTGDSPVRDLLLSV